VRGKAIVSGSGAVEFTATVVSSKRAVGLAKDDAAASCMDIEFAILSGTCW
jgi:hypothetical protein